MVDKSIDHENDVMVVFFLARAIFWESSTEMDIKNCQCFHWNHSPQSFEKFFVISVVGKREIVDNLGKNVRASVGLLGTLEWYTDLTILLAIFSGVKYGNS